MSIFKRVEDSFEFELLNIYVLQEDCLTFFVKKKDISRVYGYSVPVKTFVSQRR
jgi:hypothetical protein